MRAGKQGELHLFSRGRWFYLEWGDGLKLWIGPVYFASKVRLGWRRGL